MKCRDGRGFPAFSGRRPPGASGLPEPAVIRSQQSSGAGDRRYREQHPMTKTRTRSAIGACLASISRSSQRSGGSSTATRAAWTASSGTRSAAPSPRTRPSATAPGCTGSRLLPRQRARRRPVADQRPPGWPSGRERSPGRARSVVIIARGRSCWRSQLGRWSRGGEPLPAARARYPAGVLADFGLTGDHVGAASGIRRPGGGSRTGC